ncbi:MAG: transcription initiation factor IIB family protein [Candidatus Hodarchaeota archaeon]
MKKEDIRCPECGAHELIQDYNRGDMLCAKCGLVIDAEIMYSGPDWRAYTSEEEKDRSHAGDPVSWSRADNLRTHIGNVRRDGMGNRISKEKVAELRRQSRLDEREILSHSRNLKTAFKELDRIKSQLSLPPQVVESSAVIYRKALTQGIVRGRSIDGMIAAAIYLSARSHGFPKTLKTIQEVSNIAMKELSSCVRILASELKFRYKPTDFLALCHQLGEKLNLTIHTRQVASEIINNAQKAGLTIGKNPVSVVSASLYIAAIQTGERRTQQQIASVADTTPVTIRNRFKELVKYLNINKLDIKRGAAAVPVYVDPLKNQH